MADRNPGEFRPELFRKEVREDKRPLALDEDGLADYSKFDMPPGTMVVARDEANSRSVEIERDEFDAVYRVVVKHDPANSAVWYYFDFDDAARLNLFLEQKGLLEVVKAAS